jgi:PAS domain S-box-containing protein
MHEFHPTRKLIISILLGLGGFGLSLFSIRFNNPPFSLTITWSYFLPLLAAMAFGPLYGLAAGVLGLGAFYPFLLYPNNGWGNLVNAAAVALWFPWYGYFSDQRRKKAALWNHPYVIHLHYAVFYLVFMRFLYPIAFSLNPPFWNPQAVLSMPVDVLEGIITKGVLIMYLMVIVDVALLQVNTIRGWFGLETWRESRNNGQIILYSILASSFLWYILVLFDRIFIDKTFPQGLLRVEEPHEILALVTFASAGFFAGTILCQYVSSRLKAEDEIRKNRESYQLIFDQAADGIFIADEHGNYIDVNESGCKLIGYTRDEVLHMNLRDVVMPDEKEQVGIQVKEINRGGLVVFERQMRHKNGAALPVEISARKLPDGRLQGLVRDISQRKQVEAALKSTNELLAEFIQHSPIFAYIKEVTPTQSLTLQASENFLDMIGIAGSQMVGKTMYDLFPAEFAAKMTTDDWSVVSSDTVLTMEEKLNGRSYTTIKFPIHQGQRSFLAGYTIEITEQKRIQEQLQANQIELQRLLEETELSRRVLLSLVEDQKEAEEQIRKLNAGLEQRVTERTLQLAAANKELEAFAYSVSHDLRAPLRALEGFSTALAEDYAGQLDAHGQDYLARIREASRRMNQLINDLLTLSRVTRVEFNPMQVNLSELARSIANDLSAQAPERSVGFEIMDGITVAGDTNLVKIALENLLSNAVKFTGKCEPALIQVGVLQKGGERVFFVKDNGTGFDMQYAEKLFIPFQRLHSAQDYPGTGIGLSIVQRIIARHGGRIWVDAAVGQGATFFFTLEEKKS